MPNTPAPPPKDSERYDDWATQLHRNVTKRINFTPTLAFATPGDSVITLSTKFAELYFNGSLYVLKFNLVTSTFTHTTSSGDLTMGGLPVAASSDSGYVANGHLEQWQGITKANYTQWGCYITAGATSVGFVGSGSGQGTATLQSADMPTGGSVVLRGTIKFR